MLVDSHCHLDFPALAKIREDVMAHARAAGIGRLVNICTGRREFDVLKKTAEAYEEVYCCLGIHPHHVSEEGENIPEEDLVKATMHPKVIGIGETGLEYFYKHASPEAQESSFRRAIRAAKEARLPVVIHSRDAEEDTLRILKDENCTCGVLHCFSSRRVLAEEGLKMGLYISVSGILTFKKSEDLRAVIRDVPLDRLLVETDAPFLAPEPYRGKICEPAYVVKTAEKLAEIKGVSFDEIARQTTENFFRLFTRCPSGA